jgi:hypothetical protein
MYGCRPFSHASPCLPPLLDGHFEVLGTGAQPGLESGNKPTQTRPPWRPLLTRFTCRQVASTVAYQSVSPATCS